MAARVDSRAGIFAAIGFLKSFDEQDATDIADQLLRRNPINKTTDTPLLRADFLAHVCPSKGLTTLRRNTGKQRLHQTGYNKKFSWRAHALQQPNDVRRRKKKKRRGDTYAGEISNMKQKHDQSW